MARTGTTRRTRPDLLHRPRTWLLGALLLTAPDLALAQSASEKAAAEALFDQGVELLKKGEFQTACKKLEKSQSVDPGIGTLLYLGECYKKLGRTASAWATFREASSKAYAAGESERAEAGASRANALEPELSYVSFEVAEETSALPGLKVTQGNHQVSPALFGTKVPVDPGELKVVASAPGHESFEIALRILKGPAETTLSIPVLPNLPPSEVDEREKAAATNQPKHHTSSVEDRGPKPGASQRGAGIGLGIVGIAGLGAGAAFGILAINKDNQADDVCGETSCDPGSNGYDLSDTARTFATISTIGIAAGAALVVGGVVLYLTAPSSKSTALLVSPTVGGGQFSLAGSF